MKRLMLCVSVAATLAAAAATAGPIADSVAQTKVPLTTCMDLVAEQIGAAIGHVEFESRKGDPTYEFTVNAKGATYYVGCSGNTGLISAVDLIVNSDDPRWAAAAKITEEEAKGAATARYAGSVEEVKRLLLQSGQAVYEVDIEIPDGNGEFNVYVNAADGAIVQVNLEYWEIPESVPGDLD
ncbi:PepSY domain-containing protein [uncultured Thiodictyon sp.]|jgi:uncharacterized membrane protein YkoI|uniref:PepSY domain-containing protein n=1 Tax=uncultured Thiodictyon sp. TaxID=1846217 RepID=UPI0025ECF436|nr:PepSY domain-containing protein [uncultured Thiodictyon sp.]